MSISGKRVMLMLLGQIHPNQKPGTLGRLRIEASDYAERTGTDHRKAYRDIKNGCRELMKTIIVTHNPKAKTTTESVVVVGMEYHETQGWLDVEFSKWIEPYILQLTKTGYTSIEIDEAVRFRRFYTVRLFELLMQWEKKGEGERFITVDKLREVFQIDPKKYPRFTDFRRVVLLPSIKEIEAKTDWEVDYEPIKKGRIIDRIEFIYQRNKQQSLDL